MLGRHTLQICLPLKTIKVFGSSGGAKWALESIADHTRRPLLKANATELAGSGSDIEERMSELFSMAVKWNGIILLDEADVYMQDRALNTLQTNQMVSSKFLLGFLLESS